MFKIEDLPLRRRSWMKLAAIPHNRIGWELDDCKFITADSHSDIKAWMAAVKVGDRIRSTNLEAGVGLMLRGEPGHGKTTIALVIAQHILRTFPLEVFDVKDGNVLTRPVYFTTYAELLDLKGATMDDPTSDQLNLMSGIMGECAEDAYNIRVLVIDDVGKEHASASGWQRNMLHHVLRTRFSNGLPTIVTTNLTLDAWKAVYGDATASFISEAFDHIALVSSAGDDLRKVVK